MWNCPKCGEEVDDDFDVCWQCGTTPQGAEDPDFRSADDTGPLDDPARDIEHVELDDEADELPGAIEDLEICYEARDPVEAKFLANELISRGIPAVADRNLGIAYTGGWITQALGSTPKVRVRRADLLRARAWLETYEKGRGVAKLNDD